MIQFVHAFKPVWQYPHLKVAPCAET